MPTGSERGALAKRLQKNRNRKPKSPLKLETLKSSEPKNGDSDPVITDFKYSSNCLLQILDYDGMAYTFITPNSTADALNFLALSIKTKDLISVRIVIVCVEASEAKDVHQEMAKRGVSAILYTDTESKMWTSVWQMWMQGHLNSVLIVCDDLILKLGSQKANYIIHFTLPAFSHVFFQRFALTKESSSKIETFVIRAENDTHIFPFLKPTCRQNAAALENFSTMQINENDAIEEHCNTISPVEKEPLATYVNDFQTMADSSTSSIPSMVAAGVEPMENVPLFGNEKEAALYEKSSTEQGLSKYVHVGIVAHSRLPIPVCYQSADLLVQPQIKAAMQREGICRSYRNQRVAWLHAIKGHALTVVGPKRTGKTWCYLPALCERAYQQMLQRQPMNDGVDCDVNDCGPSAIIVVASEEQGLQLAEWCRKLLDFSQLDVEILVWLFHRSNALEVCSRLVEPCGIFLTTADLFLYVLQQSKEPNPIFNPAAICCVALDGFDDMCAQWRKCCTQLLHLLPTLLKFGPNQTQLMVTMRFWLPQMLNDLLPSSPDVQLVFEDALEAAIYGGVNFEFKVAKEPELEHNRDILEFIQGLQQNPESKNLKTQGLVIACTNLEQALQLSGFLSEHNLETSIYSAHNNASNLSLAQWRLQTTPTILITIDEVLPNLRHDHISYLINFQMPSSWTTFKDRFALLYGSYKANASTLIVARKQNEFLLWHLCTFIVKHELKMPYEFIDIFFQMRVERECLAPRNDSSLCSQFIAYGNCSRRDCRHRHIIWKSECKPPKHYPIEGVIEFQIIQVSTYL
ncbi:putative ATP-dependent RNA helicase SoYb [Scaptodrosophila lebanonensis]|uniref:RNA helicase n=1 Tax=Drosophila lebanonensis TaxID=7225 RepID=A0A6J2TQF9_DROLE|nr:putative ATP-dependent RNA helicase SoYb [Scaptodrosophila lebanonensis]